MFDVKLEVYVSNARSARVVAQQYRPIEAFIEYFLDLGDFNGNKATLRGSIVET